MNLFDLEATIRLDSGEYEKGIEQAKSKTESFSSFAIAKGQLIADGLKAGAQAVAGFVSDAVGNFSEYQQLVGGVETLFGTSADTVKSYADNAFSSAGMSANDYMDTVTSFSASLISSLGGDTAAAAEIGNMAIVDMSDNVNKMGSSMESVQNAYQGFAKGNYTMLDNLKLGRLCHC